MCSTLSDNWHLPMQCQASVPASTSAAERSWTRLQKRRRAMQQVPPAGSTAEHAVPLWQPVTPSPHGSACLHTRIHAHHICMCQTSVFTSLLPCAPLTAVAPVVLKRPPAAPVAAAAARPKAAPAKPGTAIPTTPALPSSACLARSVVSA